MKRSVGPPNGLRKPSVTVLQFALDGNKAARVPKCDTKLVLKKKTGLRVRVIWGCQGNSEKPPVKPVYK